MDPLSCQASLVVNSIPTVDSRLLVSQPHLRRQNASAQLARQLLLP